jgi:6-phosphogluconolactonase
VNVEILADADAAALRAARLVAEAAREAVAQRGRFTLAVSGGATPWQMLRLLAEEDVPWKHVHLFQVDERVAAAADPERNFTHLRKSLLDHAPLPEAQLYPMPVESGDLRAAALRYARTLAAVAGSPVVLDLVHLGLGSDGHTASLLPGDPVLAVDDADVALTGTDDAGRRRMTLTFPALDRARRILWLVTGFAKRDALRRLREADRSIPAARVRQDRAQVVADSDAAGPAGD